MADEKKSIFNFVIKATDQTTAGLAAFNRGVANSTSGVARLGASLNNLRRESGLAQLQYRAKGLGDSFRGLGADIKGSIGTIAGFTAKASLLLGAGGGGIMALAVNTARAGDEAARSARQAGIATQSWQAFAYAAQKAGINTNNLSNSFQDLGKRALAAAGNAAGNEAAFFRSAGIDVFTDASKKELKSNERLFLEAADALKELVDAGQSARATTLAEGMFGGQGKQMLEFLAQGSEGFRKAAAEAAKKGNIFGDKAVADSKAFNKSLQDSQASLKGAGYTIAQSFLPTLTRLSNRFGDVVDASRPLMEKKATEWAERFEQKLPDIESGLLKIAGAASTAFGAINGAVQMVGGWDNALIGVGGIMGVQVVAGFAAAAKSAVLFGAAVAATPIGMLALAAAATYALYKNWEKLDPYVQKGREALVTPVADAFYGGDKQTALAAGESFHAGGGWMSGFSGMSNEDYNSTYGSASDAAKAQNINTTTTSKLQLDLAPGLRATGTIKDPNLTVNQGAGLAPAMSGAAL